MVHYRTYNFMAHVTQEQRAYLLSCVERTAEWAYIWLDGEGNVQRTWERPKHVSYAEFVPPEVWQAQDDVLSERVISKGHLPRVAEAPPGIEEAEWASMWE